LRRDDAEIAASYTARFVADGALELVFGLDPPVAAAEGVGGLAIFSIGQKRSITNDDMLERSHRR
jgi:hypothetical protein